MGDRTPMGRVSRRVCLPWSGARRWCGVLVIPAETLAHVDHAPDDDRQNVIVRAVYHPGLARYDPDLRRFDARYEATRYPVDLLRDPGTLAEAAAWHAEQQPEADTSDYLDQTYVVRVDGNLLYLPMRPTVAAMLPVTEQGGTWYAVRADRSTDAWIHVWDLVSGSCTAGGPCPNCSAETMHTGSLTDVLAEVIDPANPIPPLRPDINAPSALPRFRAIYGTSDGRVTLQSAQSPTGTAAFARHGQRATACKLMTRRAALPGPWVTASLTPKGAGVACRLPT